MKRYEILGLMKDKHVSFKAWADAAGKAPKTIRAHFDAEDVTTKEIHAFGRIAGINDPYALAGLFIVKK